MKKVAAACIAGLATPLLYAAPANADTDSVDAFTRYQIASAAIEWVDTVYTFPQSDCTYFVSQALWDGGIKSTEDWTPRSSDESKLAWKSFYNPGPTKAAASANHFTNYMRSSGTAEIRPITWSDNTAAGAELGDVIAYDWNNGADGTMDHVAIITSFTDDGYPLVTQHSPTRVNRGWSWDPSADTWIEYSHPGAKAYLIHLK
ncbi:amidase domain-containing protein [Rhodococcus pyridinivorans]|uniref:amidase domain-containing protein n=1 Tax=Rhodococcus pyridinivorans TaxID=103816 RepID=UPI0022836FAE|nr:amidase domain-containing protein [Rhodococcus pyridinivorans]WAL49924.1 amidase domain-containing protein [Rhodococcus pyridinivorans]